MELWQLRTFSAVARNRHFTRAAEELNLSQPAVSHQIKLLEEEIGEPLFLRDKDGILLTQAGRTMYEHALKILDIADEMRAEVRENKGLLRGKIILGVATRGLCNPFSARYENFKRQYKDIEIEIQNEYKLETLVEKVRAGTIDIALVSHNLDLSGLVEIPYGDYEMILVVGKNHRLAGRAEITADELQNEEWMMFDTANRARVSAEVFLAKAGLKPEKIYESNDGAVVRSMIVNSQKISVLPAWGVFEELHDGKMFAVKIKNIRHRVPVSLIWKAARRTKVMSAVINYLLEEKMEGLELAGQSN